MWLQEIAQFTHPLISSSYTRFFSDNYLSLHDFYKKFSEHYKIFKPLM